MKQDLRPRRVRFIDQNLYEAYLKLKSGKTEEQKLAENLDDAIEELKKNPLCGVKNHMNYGQRNT